MLGEILHNSDKDGIYSSDDIISDNFHDHLHMDVKKKVGATNKDGNVNIYAILSFP